MSDLKILSSSKRSGRPFLGVMGDFLRETLDDDKLVKKVAPEFFNRCGQHSNRHSGLTATMILKAFSNDHLAIIKSLDAANKTAELVFFFSSKRVVSTDLLNDLRTLVSNRWSLGRLTAKVSLLEKMCPGLAKSLMLAGWKEGSNPGHLEIGLVEKYKRDRN